MSVFHNVKAYKVPPPHPAPGGRFTSVVWSETDKILSGTVRIRLEEEESYREVVLEEQDSGQFFANTYIPCHSIDLSVLNSQEHFVTKFSDGAQLLMHLGLEFSASSDARNFYRALLCQEEEDSVGAIVTVENVDDYYVGESGRSIKEDEEEEGESTRDETDKIWPGTIRIQDEEDGVGEIVTVENVDDYDVGEVGSGRSIKEEGESTHDESTGDEEEEEEEGVSTRGESTGDEEEEEDGTSRVTGKDEVLGQLSKFTKQINNVYDELREKKRELKVKERELKVKEDTVKNLEAKLKDTESEKVRLREECSAKTLRIRELEKHCNSMIQVFNESSGAFDSMRGSVDSIRGSVDSMLGRVDSAKTKIITQIDKCKKILSAP